MGLTTESGATRFARYAFPPNELGYCGPDDASVLLQHATYGGGTVEVAARARQFEGAWAYLSALSDATGLEPLDPLVVEAYWVGNDLLDKVDPQALLEGAPAAGSGPDRRAAEPGGALRRRARQPRFPRLRRLSVGAHARRQQRRTALGAGLRAGSAGARSSVSTASGLTSCPSRWTGTGPGSGWATPRTETVRWSTDGLSLAATPAPGGVVSMHWDWICERLTPDRTDALADSTAHALDMVNATSDTPAAGSTSRPERASRRRPVRRPTTGRFSGARRVLTQRAPTVVRPRRACLCDPPGLAGHGAGQLQVPGHLGRGDRGGVALLVHDRVVPRAEQRQVATGRSGRRRTSAGSDGRRTRPGAASSRGRCSPGRGSTAPCTCLGVASRTVRPRSSTSTLRAEDGRDDRGVAGHPPDRLGGEQVPGQRRPGPGPAPAGPGSPSSPPPPPWPWPGRTRRRPRRGGRPRPARPPGAGRWCGVSDPCSVEGCGAASGPRIASSTAEPSGVQPEPVLGHPVIVVGLGQGPCRA